MHVCFVRFLSSQRQEESRSGVEIIIMMYVRVATRVRTATRSTRELAKAMGSRRPITQQQKEI